MESVTLINPFEIKQGEEERAEEFWNNIAKYMRKQPGFISTRLHRAVVPWARFRLINIAEWQSIEHFQEAVSKQEFKDLTEPYMQEFPHFPGLYEVVVTC